MGSLRSMCFSDPISILPPRITSSATPDESSNSGSEHIVREPGDARPRQTKAARLVTRNFSTKPFAGGRGKRTAQLEELETLRNYAGPTFQHESDRLSPLRLHPDAVRKLEDDLRFVGARFDDPRGISTRLDLTSPIFDNCRLGLYRKTEAWSSALESKLFNALFAE
jgi:hypothetical protein